MPPLREGAAEHVYNTLPLLYWTACHNQGIQAVDRAILDTQGTIVRDWPHARELLQQGHDFDVVLSESELEAAYDYASYTLLHCIIQDNSIVPALRSADVWHMKLTGHGERSVRALPECDLERMAASQHNLDVSVHLPSGCLGRLDPVPAVVMTSAPTGALIRVDMSALSDRLEVSESLFLVERQYRVRHDFYVAQGTFLIALHSDDPDAERAWQRWVPNSEFFYQDILVQCGRESVTVNARRGCLKQSDAASELPPRFIETPNTLAAVTQEA